MPNVNDKCLKEAIKFASDISNRYAVDHINAPFNPPAAATDAMFGALGRDVYWQCVQHEAEIHRPPNHAATGRKGLKR